jgi:AAA domain
VITSANGNDRLEIVCEPPDRRGCCKVIARFDGRDVHHDQFPPFENWRRANFAEATKQKLGEILCNGSRVPTEDYFAVFPFNPGGDDEQDQLAHLQFIGDKVVAAAKKIQGDSDEPISYRTLTMAELATTEFTTEWLVDWMLVKGQPCIMAGGKKTLKTSLLLDLGISLATAGHFLGRFRVARPVRTLLMSGESGLATIQESLRRIAQVAAVDLATVENLIVSDQLPILGQLDHNEALKNLLIELRIEALLLDPAYLCIPSDGNEGSLFAMGAILRGINELCQAQGVTLILAHHTKKNIAEPNEPPELEHIAWAGFQEFARQWLLLSRREKYEPGTGSHKLWLSVGGSAGHSSLWAFDIEEGKADDPGGRYWETTVTTGAEARRDSQEQKESDKQAKREEKLDIQLAADMDAVVRASGKFPEGETPTIIRNRTGLGSGRFSRAVARLIEDKKLTETTITKGNKREYDALKLAPDQED